MHLERPAISSNRGTDPAKDDTNFDETYWRELRKRLRERTNRQMGLILCPFVAVVSVLKIVEPMDYPTGDFRNELMFRLVFYGVFIAVCVVGFVAAVRWLMADQRRG